MARYAIITELNLVVNVVEWAPDTAFQASPYQAYNAEGNPVGNPQPITSVPDTDPSTAQIGFIYNPADGSFTNQNAQPVTVSSPGLISRILSALNPFN